MANMSTPDPVNYGAFHCAVCNRADPHTHADLSVERDTLVHIFTKSVIDLTGERNKLETERNYFIDQAEELRRALRQCREALKALGTDLGTFTGEHDLDAEEQLLLAALKASEGMV